MTGRVVRTVTSIAGTSPDPGRARRDILRVLGGDRGGDEVARARDALGRGRPGERRVPGAFGSGVEHGVAHVQRQGELHDRQRQHGEEDADERELGYGGSALIREEARKPATSVVRSPLAVPG